MTFDQFSDDIWVTAVQVATVWTSPASPRTIDRHGVTNPTDIDKWIAGLTYETTVALTDEDRVQTQLLYGEPVIITETTDEWAHVVIPSQSSIKDERGYPGWVPLAQLERVNKSDWERAMSAAVSDKYLWLENEAGEKIRKLSYMTILPVIHETDDRICVATPHGTRFLPRKGVQLFHSQQGLPKQPGEQLIADGKRHLGLSYFWGGMSAFGYDCSGFAYAMHKANGYIIPRDASDQARDGEVVPIEAPQPGDLLFFAYEEGKGRLHHVGFYCGDGKMLHSPQAGKGIEIISIKGTKYEKELCAARRYWEQTEESQ
ncbi:NlpC/P60 family protein [Lentibacillus cibarius]|uniref:NlpC/P60 family protein n=1 Tax=Lentibacillus cibarius TaxID=2583219 RepID=A0A549YFX7_9BACI|nr:C40 family peptidase [Lentibacillus cibarius]TRM10747.1 NlpC/P60 family protein [Lentibacillus cibarius]